MLCVTFRFDTEVEARAAMEKMCTSLVGFKPFIEDDVIITDVRDHSDIGHYNFELIIGKKNHPDRDCLAIVEQPKVLLGKPNKK